MRRLDAVVVALVACDPQVAGVVAVGVTAYVKALRDAGRQVPDGVDDLLDAIGRVARSGQLQARVASVTEDQGVLVDLNTAATLLGLSVRTVRRRTADGSLPVTRIGRRVQVNPVDVLALLEAS